jgi:hypothetical protein
VIIQGTATTRRDRRRAQIQSAWKSLSRTTHFLAIAQPSLVGHTMIDSAEERYSKLDV